VASSESSESNTRRDLWAQHYREASERRRARGWHRRDGHLSDAHGSRRVRVYVAVAVAFVALTIVALVIPR
jgi:hypothetical protein